MGDVADMMLDGTLCQGCGGFLNEDPPGYPCTCADCGGGNTGENKHGTPKSPAKCNCPKCGKRLKKAGLQDHLRDIHGDDKELKDALQLLAKCGQRVRELEAQHDRLTKLVTDCQAVLAAYLPPDGASKHDTIAALLGLLDGPQSREALATCTKSQTLAHYGEQARLAELEQTNAELVQVAVDLKQVMQDEGITPCECGEADCRTTRLRAVLAKAGVQ